MQSEELVVRVQSEAKFARGARGPGVIRPGNPEVRGIYTTTSATLCTEEVRTPKQSLIGEAHLGPWLVDDRCIFIRRGLCPLASLMQKMALDAIRPVMPAVPDTCIRRTEGLAAKGKLTVLI